MGKYTMRSNWRKAFGRILHQFYFLSDSSPSLPVLCSTVFDLFTHRWNRRDESAAAPVLGRGRLSFTAPRAQERGFMGCRAARRSGRPRGAEDSTWCSATTWTSASIQGRGRRRLVAGLHRPQKTVDGQLCPWSYFVLNANMNTFA